MLFHCVDGYPFQEDSGGYFSRNPFKLAICPPYAGDICFSFCIISVISPRLLSTKLPVNASLIWFHQNSQHSLDAKIPYGRRHAFSLGQCCRISAALPGVRASLVLDLISFFFSCDDTKLILAQACVVPCIFHKKKRTTVKFVVFCNKNKVQAMYGCAEF